MAAINGGDVWESISRGIVNGFVDGFIMGAAFYCVAAGVKAIVHAANTAKAERSAQSADAVKASYKLDPRSIEAAKQGNPTWGTFRKRVWMNEAKFNPGAYEGQLSRMSLGKAPIGIDGKSMHLHHVLGKGDMYNVIKLSQAQDIALHQTIGYHYNQLWNLIIW